MVILGAGGAARAIAVELALAGVLGLDLCEEVVDRVGHGALGGRAVGPFAGRGWSAVPSAPPTVARPGIAGEGRRSDVVGRLRRYPLGPGWSANQRSLSPYNSGAAPACAAPPEGPLPGPTGLPRNATPDDPATAMEITLYTLSSCPHCMRAVALLESKGLAFTNHVMDDDFAGLNAAKAQWGHPTVPIVIIDGVLVGGADALFARDAAGGLG